MVNVSSDITHYIQLTETLDNSELSWTDMEILQFAYGILAAVEELHRNDIVHGGICGTQYILISNLT